MQQSQKDWDKTRATFSPCEEQPQQKVSLTNKINKISKYREPPPSHPRHQTPNCTVDKAVDKDHQFENHFPEFRRVQGSIMVDDDDKEQPSPSSHHCGPIRVDDDVQDRHSSRRRGLYHQESHPDGLDAFRNKRSSNKRH